MPCLPEGLPITFFNPRASGHWQEVSGATSPNPSTLWLLVLVLWVALATLQFSPCPHHIPSSLFVRGHIGLRTISPNNCPLVYRPLSLSLSLSLPPLSLYCVLSFFLYFIFVLSPSFSLHISLALVLVFSSAFSVLIFSAGPLCVSRICFCFCSSLRIYKAMFDYLILPFYSLVFLLLLLLQLLLLCLTCSCVCSHVRMNQCLGFCCWCVSLVFPLSVVVTIWLLVVPIVSQNLVPVFPHKVQQRWRTIALRWNDLCCSRTNRDTQ